MTTDALDAPDAADAAAFVADARNADLAVSLVGDCAAAFEGRTERDVPAGTRQVLCKPDDTVLVHGASGRDPVAWSSGGAVEASAEGDALVLRCGGDDAADALTVRFDTVHCVTAFDAADEDGDVSGTEADLKERVLADPDIVEPGFRPLATERDTPAGRVDVYGRDADGAVVAVELKNVRAGPSAASQLSRYVDALRRDLHADADVRGILVAPDVTEKTRRLLAADGLDYSSV
ncbi:endonuclease NucS [Halobacterium litoreum]|uniref:Endonuclease NucS n=1 Tax=Halobacterium litoreum TaxID=2039234 RepID=A0ABD5NG08_9EURY|nr:endonuclease NucS [Halobacterium litoreum]UHH12866.1 endonuclease NucS [Halobacterium litoreum]